MSSDHYVSPDPRQDRRWRLGPHELEAAVLRQWPDAKVVGPVTEKQVMDIDIAHGGQQYHLTYFSVNQSLVAEDRDPLLGLAEIIRWFLDTLGPDTPAIYFSPLDPDPQPVSAAASAEDIARDLLGARLS